MNMFYIEYREEYCFLADFKWFLEPTTTLVRKINRRHFLGGQERGERERLFLVCSDSWCHPSSALQMYTKDMHTAAVSQWMRRGGREISWFKVS